MIHMTDIPTNAHTFEIRLQPDGSAMDDFNAWVEGQKVRLAAAGLTVTAVQGACFSGYYYPDQVDQTLLDAI